MPFLVKPKDMGTAELEDLRYSKKRCDRLRNIFCGGSCLAYALNLLLMLENFPKFLVMPIKDLLLTIAIILVCAAGIISEVVAKEEVRYYAFAYAARVAVIILDYQIEELNLFTATHFILTASTLIVQLLSIYNERLSEVDGYPYFTRHKESIRREAMTREQVKAQYSGNGIVDPEEFFTKKTMEELHAADEKSKEIDKSDWLGS